jgi:hypothetical protein
MIEQNNSFNLELRMIGPHITKKKIINRKMMNILLKIKDNLSNIYIYIYPGITTPKIDFNLSATTTNTSTALERTIQLNNLIK